MTDQEPFWEAGYRDGDADVFGPPSDHVRAIAGRLPASAPVLDAGCGDGRNALFLAQQGFPVHAFDVSEAAIRKLRGRARRLGVSVEARVGRLEDFELPRDLALVLMTGILQFIARDAGDHFVARARQHTLPGGYHVVGVFTDAAEVPEDLAPFVTRLYREDELRGLYDGWEIESYRTYIKEDEHAGGLKHRHALCDLVARRPLG